MGDEISELEPIPFIIATERLDRHSERLLLDGVVLDDFKKNPVGYYNHFRSFEAWWSGDKGTEETTPIVKWTNIRIEEVEINGENTRALLADAIFDPEDEFSVKIYKKVKGGFINSSSVGFVPVEWSYDEELMVQGQQGATYTKWKLLEVSIVDMPSNVDAIAQREHHEDEDEKGEGSSDDDKKGKKFGKTRPFAYKSFSEANTFIIKSNLTSKPTTKMGDEKNKKGFFASLLDLFNGKGISLKKSDGTDATAEDLEAIDGLQINIGEAKINEIVLKKFGELDEKLKSTQELLTEVTKNAVSMAKVTEQIDEKLKGFSSKEDHQKLVGEIANLKGAPSGGGKPNNGDGGFNTPPVNEDDDTILKGNPQYKQLLELKEKGLISDNLFKKQSQGLLAFVKAD